MVTFVACDCLTSIHCVHSLFSRLVVIVLWMRAAKHAIIKLLCFAFLSLGERWSNDGMFVFYIHLDREQNIFILLIAFSSKRHKVHSTVFFSSGIERILVVIMCFQYLHSHVVSNCTILCYCTMLLHYAKFLLVQVSCLEYIIFAQILLIHLLINAKG